MQTTIAYDLIEFWKKRVQAKCITSSSFPVSAGTGAYRCGLGVLNKSIDPTIYIQDSYRYDDCTLGSSLVRFAKHTQLQLIMPYYPNVYQDYLDSLKHIGWDATKQNIQFVHNDWKHESLGARGVGAEVLCDNMEITQFTFFEYMGNQELYFTPVEIAYGIERLEICFSTKKLEYRQGLELQEEIETNSLGKINLYTIDDFHAINRQIARLLENKLVVYAYNLLLIQNLILNILIMSISHADQTVLLQKTADNATKIASCYRELQYNDKSAK